MSTSDEEKTWIRGVNIGGWLLLERFIVPYFFAITTCHLKGDFRFYPNQIDAPPTSSPLYKAMDAEECKPILPYPVDEWTFTDAFDDKEIAKKYLEIHYDNFVSRDDITMLRENGVTHIRVPLGHWITGNIADDEPYVSGGWPYFKRLVGWCREEGIEVWPDIHTAPGSQNGFDNSGRTADGDPTCHGWDMDNRTATEYNATELSIKMGLTDYTEGDVVLSNNVLRTLQIVDEITAAIARDGMTDVVTGFGDLNEPMADCDLKVVQKFDDMAFDIIRKNMGSDTKIYIGEMFNSTLWNDGYWTDEKYKGTYLDSHYYHVFDERPRHLDPKEHIGLVCQKNHRDTVACCYEDEAKMEVPSEGIRRIIGEWSASFDTLVCDKLDVVMAGIAENGTAAEFDREIPSDRKAFLRNFVEAQMISYEAKEEGVSDGWFYWTLKMEGGAFAEWDFTRGLKEGWIPKIPAKNVASTDLYGSCYDIIFRTSNDDSFVHEFPDPSSLKLDNWQGFEIDDDVVRSHGHSLERNDKDQWFDPNSVVSTDADPAATTAPTGSPESEKVPFVDTFLFKELIMLAFVSVLFICFKGKPQAGYTALDSSDTKNVELSV